MDPETYRRHLRGVIAQAKDMHAAGSLDRAWFTGKFIESRADENQDLFACALELGYNLGCNDSPPSDTKVPARMMQFLTRDQIFARPDPQWLIKGLLVENAFSIVYAQSKSLKSYLVLNIAGQLATGGQFFDGQTLRQTGVVSIVLEGAHGMRSRIDAWETHHGRRLEPEWFRQVEDWQNLMDPAEVQNLIDNLRLLVADGFPLGMIIIDTASKALGGGDTMNHADACAFCEACIRIQREFGCNLILVHHTGKDEDGGIIGSNAWLTQPDCVIKVHRPDKHALGVTVTVEKQKSAPDGQRHKMLARLVDLDTGIGGDLVLLPDDKGPRALQEQAEQRDATDAVELALLMGPADRMSMNKVCVMSKAQNGRFRTPNGGTYDLLKRLAPSDKDEARVVRLSGGGEARLWRDGEGYICKSEATGRSSRLDELRSRFSSLAAKSEP